MRPSATAPRRLVRAGSRAAVGMGAAAALGLAWGLVEAEARVVRTHRLAVLPAGADPVRVLHLSDIHLLPRNRSRMAWLRGLDALEPDLVVNTGDNISAAASVPLVLDALGPLLRRPGVFVPGSNDYYEPKPANPFRYLAGPSRMDEDRARLPTEALFGAFRAAGWADLTNRGSVLSVPTRAGTVLEVLAAGTDDPHLGLDAWGGFPAPAPAPAPAPGDAAASGPASAHDDGAARPGGDGRFRLGVTHAPYRRVLDAMTVDGADLLLAGHTHGGQVCLPGFGALVTNCDLPRAQASGVSTWTAAGRTVPLEVSAGLGTAPSAPVRFACRPEAVVLELLPRA